MPHSTANLMQIPVPSESDVRYSEKLEAKIKATIEQQGDISFAQYMNRVLYEDGLGYYVSGLRKFGEQGDFITSPEISALFGQTLAHQIATIFSQSTIKSVFELGAGTGKLAFDILSELEKLNALPEQYIILDISGEMQLRQQELIAEKCPHLLNRVSWINKWPEAIDAVVIANEVLDAMPVERFLYNDNKVLQQKVSIENGQLKLIFEGADEALSKKVMNAIGQVDAPYLSEISMNYLPWFSSLNKAIKSGVLLFIDYGYPRSEYYLNERKQGTLVCFYRHHVNDDVLLNPGLQDVTAFVDFTEVVESATEAGFSFEGFVAQADFLLSNNITQITEKKMAKLNDIDTLAVAKQVKQLTLPGEMGERFKVIGFSKNFEPEIDGFANNDQSYRL